MFTFNERDLTKPDHLLRASFYRSELKCSSDRECYGKYARWGNPGRIWVRGYSKDGRIVYEKTIGYADMRYSTPRSRCGRLIAQADRIARTLSSISRYAKRRGGLKLTGLKLDDICVTHADTEAAWCRLKPEHEDISARELLQVADNQLTRRLIIAAAIRQGMLKGRQKKAA